MGNINRDKDLKQSLRLKELTVGSWLTVGDTVIAEIMAKLGFDWLTIDLEHSSITLAQAMRVIQVVQLSGVQPLVRVGKNDANLIKRVMDIGSCGVIVPMVNTPEDAEKAVAAVKYPPLGTRGVGLYRAQGYGLSFEEYKSWVEKSSVVVVQIEHIKAIDNLEQILTTKGVDASIIGPYDLSASLGYPGQFQRPAVEQALQEYERVCRRLNKPMGIHSVAPHHQEVLKYIEKGYKFVAFSSDILFLGIKAKEEVMRVVTKS